MQGRRVHRRGSDEGDIWQREGWNGLVLWFIFIFVRLFKSDVVEGIDVGCVTFLFFSTVLFVLNTTLMCLLWIFTI